MVDKQKIGTFVLGGVAGALAGILLAPKSGKELRGSMANRAGEARERSRETYFEAQERVQERFAEARERAPRREGDRPVRAVGDPLPRLGSPNAEPLIESLVESPPTSFPLRDVSQEAFQEVTRPVSEEEPDPEKIRRKIQETRSRLRARLETPEAEGPSGERDGRSESDIRRRNGP
jgi:gas vesicle protein